MTSPVRPPRWKGRPAAARAVVVGTTIGISALLAAPAMAHGALVDPPSRTYVCYQEDPQHPKSDACKAAVAAGGTQPLYDWFAVLISNANGRGRDIIPDGHLCGAGTEKYAAYDAPRADWPATTLRSGADYTFHYAAWAPHPGRFDLYVTKPGYNPTKPLAWSDLEDQPFLTATDPPKVPSDSSPNGAYEMKGKLPAGRTGPAIIYAIWTRSDSQENFFGCSDVVFTNDSGGSPGQPAPTPTGTATLVPSSPPVTTPPPTSAPTTPPGTPPVTTPPTTGLTWSQLWDLVLKILSGVIGGQVGSAAGGG